jgi:hypothetical protein
MGDPVVGSQDFRSILNLTNEDHDPAVLHADLHASPKANRRIQKSIITNASPLAFEDMISFDRPPDQLGLYVDTESSFFSAWVQYGRLPALRVNYADLLREYAMYAEAEAGALWLRHRPTAAPGRRLAGHLRWRRSPAGGCATEARPKPETRFRLNFLWAETVIRSAASELRKATTTGSSGGGALSQHDQATTMRCLLSWSSLSRQRLRQVSNRGTAEGELK